MEPKKRPITIKDLARILEISVSTVSRALRDTYDVNPETKEKVLALAAELNYKPNFNATGLAKGSTRNIGIITPHITNYYFATVITGIQELAFKEGFKIILFVTNDSPERELEIAESIAITSLDGLLVSISSNTDECVHFQKLIDEGMPIVFFDRVPNEIEASKVVQDDYEGALQGTIHLINSGYKKIAHIAGPKGLAFTANRLQGYLDALAQYNMEPKDEWIVHSGFSQAHGEQDCDHLLSLDNPPDAIFAVNDRKAIGAMLSLKRHKVKIGEEVGVVGFTNDPMSVIISPTLTTIAEPAFEIGQKSCELLIKHITKTYFEGENIILPNQLIVRESSIRS
ncbi:LacI family DNA-binding transcriptional regulator [Albibacterium indicum]|uniref:LacI family DNA-binding transcriptional regulator n=1 Tax=Albibacterium indicum TaxID=2292082 RepID=UPI000E52BF3D|nr:LacI family DNA-binding transcriptional regulator [Pedobacter indicus]